MIGLRFQRVILYVAGSMGQIAAIMTVPAILFLEADLQPFT